MDFFFFGSNNEIFGAYHQANLKVEKSIGVILLYPFGQEYIRCHKAFVILSNKLARNGFHTLRFDYSGTGDSQGDLEAVSMSDWLGNISIAIQEIKNGSGVEKIILIGLRLGAAVALLSSKIVSVEGIILWHPVLNGRSYIREISESHQKWAEGSFAKIIKVAGSYEFQGFEISKLFKQEIEEVDVLNLGKDVDVKTLIIHNLEDLSENKLSPLFKDPTFIYSGQTDFWHKKSNEIAKELIPVKDIDSILSWINCFDEDFVNHT